MFSGKVLGEDGIFLEVYKYGGDEFVVELICFFKEFWVEGEVLQDFKDVFIIYFYKNKGDRCLCDNYCGILFFSNVGKIFVRVIVNCFIIYFDSIFLES